MARDSASINRDTKIAVNYHAATMHSELSRQISRHYMDWDDRPRPFKVYPELPSIPLPGEFGIPSSNALDCISDNSGGRPGSILGIRDLARLLFFTGGVTRAMKFDTGTYYMRAASATGALYPIEMYVVCRDIGNDDDKLASGIYHFNPGEFSLTQLRAGDWRGDLAAAAGQSVRIASSPATIVFTSLAWRNAWKYRARSYRHWFWDSGVMAANLLAVCASEGFATMLAMGFVDRAVNDLLFLETRKEAAIVLAPLADSGPAGDDIIQHRDREIHIERPRSRPAAKNEVEYPEIWELQEASKLATAGDVASWTSSLKNEKQANMPSPVQPNEHSISIGETILRRGSTRRFAHRPISYEALLSILYSSTRGVPLDFIPVEGTSLADIYFISNQVDGLEAGRYFYDRATNSIQQLEALGEAAGRSESGYLCLNQPLFADASAVFFLMSDLKAALGALGNRGYRAAQFEAGVMAGKIYLSSYSLGLGASGSTFYDEAVTEAFSPHSEEKSAMIAIGIGMPDYKAASGRILAARLTKSELLS